MIKLIFLIGLKIALKMGMEVIMQKNKMKKTLVPKDYNVVDLLLLDHKTLKRCCEILLDEAEDKKKKLSTSKQFVQELFKHTVAEEKVVYTYLLNHQSFRSLALDSNVEHDIIKQRIKKIHRLINGARSYKDEVESEVKILAQLVKNHLMNEESEIFPLMQETLDKLELYELGGNFLKKRKLETKSDSPYPILQEEIVQWKDSVQKISSQILGRMSRHVEDLRH
jgi:hemerythrin-like domain-containing protein